MRKWKAATSLALALVMLASLISGCGSASSSAAASSKAASSAAASSAAVSSAASKSASSEEKVTITWATWALSEDSLRPIYQSMIDTFMAAHPNVTINTVTYPYSQYKDQLMIAVAGGNAPTFAHIKADWAKELYDTGMVKTLNTAMSKDLQSDYYANVLAGETVDGKIIAAPWFITPSAMFYNKTLLAKAGITTLPKTWDELIKDEYAVANLGTDDNGNKIYGTVLPNVKGEYGASFLSMPFLWAEGGGYTTDSSGKVSIKADGNLAAFKQIQKLYQDGVSPNGCTMVDGCNLFAQGLVGFYHYIQTGVSTFASASPLGADFAKEYGVMAMPGDGKTNGSGYLTEHDLIFFDNGTLTDAQETVISELIDWFSGENVMRILYNAGMGKIPARTSTAKLDIFTTKADDVTKVFVEAAATCKSLPVSDPNFTSIDEAFVDALSSLASSGDSADTVYNTLADKVAALG